MLIKYITDNGGITADRYTVYFWDNTYLALSENCDSPQGVSQWGYNSQHTNSDLMVAAMTDETLENEIMINVFELPTNVAEHLKRRMQER